MSEVAGSSGYAFHIEGLEPRLQVTGFEGDEAISELFELRITLACADEALVFADVVGRAAKLSLRGEGEPRILHGIVSRFDQGDEGEPLTAYHATLVPSAGLTILVGTGKSESIGMSSTGSVGADQTTTVGGDCRITVGGKTTTSATAAEEEISGSKTVRVGTRFELVVGESRVVVEPSGKIVIEGPDVEIRSSGPVKVEGAHLQVKSSGAVQVTAATRVDFKGRRIEIN